VAKDYVGAVLLQARCSDVLIKIKTMHQHAVTNLTRIPFVIGMPVPVVLTNFVSDVDAKQSFPVWHKTVKIAAVRSNVPGQTIFVVTL
jgi:hypothetical protein